MQTKGALSSLGVWGSLLALVPGVGSIAAVLGVIDPVVVQDAVTAIIGGVGALIALFGRIRATSKIKGL